MLAATRQNFLDDYIKISHAEGRGYGPNGLCAYGIRE